MKWILAGIFMMMFSEIHCQQVYFFTEGTTSEYYDQGIVNVNGLGESTFEHTYPPGAPQYNDKVPCSTIAYDGETSLKFNYTSAENGNWRATIYRTGWTAAGIEGLDSVSFYVYAENELPASALPLIGLRTNSKTGSGGVNSELYKLEDYNESVPPEEWTRILFPLDVIFNDTENNELDFSQVTGVVFNQSEKNNTSRLILIDEIVAFQSIDVIPPVKNLTAEGYDSHAELNWQQPLDNLTYRIYASYDGGENFEFRGETTKNFYLDFVPEEGKNSTVHYQIVGITQDKESEAAEATAEIRDFTDEELLDMVQRYTFRYFWEGAHQPSGMILERSGGNGRTAASGATGMGLMAMIVACERQYEPQDSIKNRIIKILDFLENCERHHGAWSHWYNANTGETQPFSPDDDGGDIVETSYVAQGLIALKQYFSGSDEKSVQIREKADQLWKEVEWDWYRNGQDVLYWHWSPNTGFEKGMLVRGWNEALITYIMAAASPSYPISKEVYTEGWARNGNMVNRRRFYEQNITLAPNWGGPLFFIHYTHLGINPHGLSDQYADYWQEHVNTAEIHHAYSIDNPKNFENYSAENWGLTASDDPYGYTAHQPWTNDNGTISPTAALSSMPYTPEKSMAALKYFYRERGAEFFGKYGPYDAFNDEVDWVSNSYIGIDQGPIAVMIENYRTGLLWNVVMQDEDVQTGLDKLGFEYQISTRVNEIAKDDELLVYPNPAGNEVNIALPASFRNQSFSLKVFNLSGQMIQSKEFQRQNTLLLDCSELQSGYYLIRLQNRDLFLYTRFLIQKQ